MDLCALDLQDPALLIQEIAPQLRACGSVEQACTLFVREMYQRCLSGVPGERALVLSRLYLSLPFSALDVGSQEYARTKSGAEPAPGDPYLTLLGTWGDEPSWHSRAESRGHRAIPLNRRTLDSAPMLARCFQQIGFSLDQILHSEAGIHLEGVSRSFGLFHVEEALGSPYVPAQEQFVVPYGVRTVVGCGTMLLNGAVSIWIGFTRRTFSQHASVPLIALMPAFWHLIQPLFRRRAFYVAK